MNYKMKLEQFLEFLETYHGRDKILRLVCYTCKLISGLSKSDKPNKIYYHLNECRTILRLFDDIPMLSYTLSYGLGKKEPDKYMQICGFVSNILDQLYYPLEHVAWASDKKLLSVRSDKWWTLSTICWVVSVYFCLIKSLRYLSVIRKHKSKLEVERNVGVELAMASRLQINEILTALRCSSDLIYAIHWLPSGILWSGKLSDLQVGALGTFSSIISLVQSFYSVTNISIE